MQKSPIKGNALDEALTNISNSNQSNHKRLLSLATSFVNSLGVYNINDKDLVIYSLTADNKQYTVTANEFVYEMIANKAGKYPIGDNLKYEMLEIFSKYFIVIFNNEFHLHLDTIHSKPILICNESFIVELIDHLAQTYLSTF